MAKHKRGLFKNVASVIGDRVAGLRKRSKIILVVGTWIVVVTMLIAFGL